MFYTLGSVTRSSIKWDPLVELAEFMFHFMYLLSDLDSLLLKYGNETYASLEETRHRTEKKILFVLLPSYHHRNLSIFLLNLFRVVAMSYFLSFSCETVFALLFMVRLPDVDSAWERKRERKLYIEFISFLKNYWQPVFYLFAKWNSFKAFFL